MVLDYKDVSFSFNSRKARRRRQKLRLALLLILALAGFLGYRYLKTQLAVNRIQELLLAGRLPEAEQSLQAVRSPLFHPGNIRELRALLDLYHGRLDEAESQLKKLGQEKASTSLRSGRMQKYFFDRGDYRQLKIYTDYLLPRGDDETRWYSALYQAAFLNPIESEKAVAGLSPAYQEVNGKALGILAQFNRSLRSGQVDYIFDRNDRAVAYFDVRRRSTRSLVPGIDFSDFDAQFKQGARFFRLALDSGLQKKVDLLFKEYFGSLVLLDLPENGIAVAYSRPRSATAANAAFAERFEPGSIVKIVSLLAYLRRAGTGIFPLNCLGRLPVGGSILYDLAKHGQVRDFSRALALSCNISFTRMGQAVGFRDLTGLLRRFFFDSPAFSDQFLKFAAGTISPGRGDDLQLAELATGLNGVTLTTLHAGVLAAIFSQSGQFFPPYLIDDAKSILGLGFYRHAARPQQLLADDLNFLRVRKAMTAVVEDEEGTGRRAFNETIRLAIKTGTASNPAGGLDAIIAGFFPSEKPRYAFAFRLEGGGRADVNGAYFLRDLVRILYPN